MTSKQGVVVFYNFVKCQMPLKRRKGIQTFVFQTSCLVIKSAKRFSHDRPSLIRKSLLFKITEIDTETLTAMNFYYFTRRNPKLWASVTYRDNRLRSWRNGTARSSVSRLTQETISSSKRQTSTLRRRGTRRIIGGKWRVINWKEIIGSSLRYRIKSPDSPVSITVYCNRIVDSENRFIISRCVYTPRLVDISFRLNTVPFKSGVSMSRGELHEQKHSIVVLLLTNKP